MASKLGDALEKVWPWVELAGSIGTAALPPIVGQVFNTFVNEYKAEAQRQGITEQQLIANIKAKFASYDEKSDSFQTELDADKAAGKA